MAKKKLEVLSSVTVGPVTVGIGRLRDDTSSDPPTEREMRQALEEARDRQADQMRRHRDN